MTGSQARALLPVLEADTYGFWSDFARRSGGEHGKSGGAVWWRSGVPFVTYNGVGGVAPDLDSMFARVQAWGVPARWTVSSAHTPHDYESALASRGLTLYDEWPGMVAGISDLPRPEFGATTCETVQSESQADEWSAVMCDAFGAPPNIAAYLCDAHRWPDMHRTGLRYLILRIDGEAVATGLLRSAAGVAGVYGITVKRQYQRRGLGRLATLATIVEGARRGATVAVLQATTAGYPIYRRLGFQTITTFRAWR